ncbi:hypothetical protein ATCC90586_006663 [Pythium insidiosum]|nr:hypothetical protein ATCC90586_006663 [Pythium insidiosum]
MVNAVDTTQRQTTPLIAACRGCKGFADQRAEIVRLLVKAGADVNHQDARGDNALHWCARTSNMAALRMLLKVTDAAAGAVVAENGAGDKPLDIALRVLERRQTYATKMTHDILRSVDRECNVRLKLQVIKRFEQQVERQRAAHVDSQWVAALELIDVTLDTTERMWNDAIARAESNRGEAEKQSSRAAAHAAEMQARTWLESKEAKAYLKKEVGIVTDEIKAEVQRGKMAKPKDIKLEATTRVKERYIRDKEAAASRTATDAFRAKRPPYPTDPARLQSMLAS